MNIMELLADHRQGEVGKVLDASEPLIEWCPLFEKVRGIKRITSESRLQI